MNVQSAFNIGVEGFQKATEAAGQAASDIVHATHDHASQSHYSSQSHLAETSVNETAGSSNNPPNLNESIVNLTVAEHQAKASANVIKTADEVLGTLIDVSI